MTQEQAQARATEYWGAHGAAGLVEFWKHSKYVVGTTTLPTTLGGHVSKVYGASWKGFEEAFQNAIMSGHIPGTGFEDDEAIQFEA